MIGWLNLAAAVGAADGAPRLAFPLACEIGVNCEIQNYVDRDPGPGVRDYRCLSRTYQAHNGVDIRIPSLAAQRAGVDVLAAAPGRVSRLRDGVADISVKAAGAPSVANMECGNGVVVDHGAGWETQYCHLARGSLKVKVGDVVSAGQAIARVGLSGNTEYPHLHMTLRHGGAVVDPFSADPTATCGAGLSLWAPTTAARLAYKSGAVLNMGFSSGPVSAEAVETQEISPASPGGAALVAYVRAIGLEGGDVQELSVRAPDGSVWATVNQPPLDRAKAQYNLFVGKKRPPAGFQPGEYRAVYLVRRKGTVVVRREIRIKL